MRPIILVAALGLALYCAAPIPCLARTKNTDLKGPPQQKSTSIRSVDAMVLVRGATFQVGIDRPQIPALAKSSESTF